MAEPGLVRAPPEGMRRVTPLPDAFIFPAPLVDAKEDASGSLDGLQRFEDPRGEFGVLYCASSEEAAYGDDIAQYRPRVVEGKTIRARWNDYFGIGPDPTEPTAGELPSSYFEDRVVVSIMAQEDALFVDLDDPETHAALDEGLPDVLASNGLTNFDRHVVMGPDRRITGAIARYFYSLSQRPGFEYIAGLRYVSLLAARWERWAIWNQNSIYMIAEEPGHPVTRDDPNLQAAAAELGITLPPGLG